MASYNQNRGGSQQRRPSGSRSSGRPPQGSPSRRPAPQQGAERRSSIGSAGRSGSRPVDTSRRNNQYARTSNYRTMSGHDTGYTLHHNGNGRGRRNSGRAHRGSGPHFALLGNRNRSRILAAAAVIALVILVIVCVGCVRGCQQRQEAAKQESTNQLDSRVSAKASKNLTNELTVELDRAEKLQWIAANANRYKSERTVELACLEPDAIDFVMAVPDSDGKAKEFNDSVEKGTCPKLFDWDTRWGFVSYGDSNVGTCGSGPTALAMAYMGLTGKTDVTPATLAQAATNDGYATGDTSTSEDFFTVEAASLGLSITNYDPTAENLQQVFATASANSDFTVVLVQLKAKFDSPYAHWALIAAQNENGTYLLYDPTCSDASSHEWAGSTIMASAETIYTLSVDANAQSSDSGDSSTSATSDASGSSTGTTTSSNDASSSQDASGNSGKGTGTASGTTSSAASGTSAAQSQ